jgi:hypothetical protein
MRIWFIDETDIYYGPVTTCLRESSVHLPTLKETKVGIQLILKDSLMVQRVDPI